MDKMTVVLDKKGMALSLDGKSLRIDMPEGKFQRIPLGMVGQVIVHGNPRVECNVWRKLAESGIPSLLLPARGKGEGAWITPASVLRLWSDCPVQDLVGYGGEAKGCRLGGQRKVQCHAGDGPATGPGVSVYSTGTERLDPAASLDEIRGVEGSAAREWFAFMAGLIPDKWGFTGRNRRPPKDPVNALLSLGYTLLLGEVHKAVLARGLDPGIGFLHAPYPGRHSLALT